MAPKRPAPVENPPSASSSEEEEEETSSSEEVEVSDDEESPSSPPQPQSKTPRIQKPTPKKSKPTTQESESAAAATQKKSAAGKRGKGADREPDKSGDSTKKLFQRLWTEEDEIVLLLGIIDFTAENGYTPSNDMKAFFNIIKNSLHFDVSITQLKDKIWRSKKKFENQLKGKGGENKTFSKPHDQKWFDLSKRIWGSEGVSKANQKRSEKSNDNESGKEVLEAGLDERDFSELYTNVDDYVGRRGLNFVRGRQKAEMKEKWKKVREAELELYLKRGKLMLEQAEVMLSAFKAESADKD